MSLQSTEEEQNITNVPDFILPGAADRTIIVGQNGSGKTYFGVWLLSYQDTNRRPWIVIDYKREELFAKLGRGAYRDILRPTSPPPKKPGLYLLQPMESDDDDVDAFLWRVWKRGGIGLYIDEGTMIPAGRGSAMRAILTQGRSKKIPVIALSQRPVDIDRCFFTESKYFASFFLLDRDDRLTVRRYAPIDPDAELPEFSCFWYDSKRRILLDLQPVPESGTFLERIRNKAPKRLWFDL